MPKKNPVKEKKLTTPPKKRVVRKNKLQTEVEKIIRKPRITRKKLPTPAIKPETQELVVEESKYYSPIQEKQQAFGSPSNYELPEGYGDNKIVLMVRDPYWLYSYWEINQKRIAEIKNELGEKYFSSQKILRVYYTEDWSFFDIYISEWSKNWYINVGRPNASFCIDVGFITPDGIFICAARSNVVKTPRDRMSEVVDEEWMIPNWETLYALSGGFKLGQGSFALRQLMEKNLLKQVSSPGMSSPTRKPLSKKPFWLVANCELIVYGATEPTAKLKIQGRLVKLNEDGTFSIRFSLPDGTQTIPIEAIRDDGQEKRDFSTKVERQTKK